MGAAAGPRISIVMPVYNEALTVREIVRRVLAQAGTIHELIIVDDGSSDGSRELISKLAGRRDDVEIRTILRDRNGGKGAALREGFAAATGDIIVVQDADLEYDPADYSDLVRPIADGLADAVFGSRFSGARHNVLLFWHTLANHLLTLACNVVSNLNLSDVWTGAKAFRADLIKRVPFSAKGFEFEPEITIKLAQLGCRIWEVPVSYQGRSYAEGKKIGFLDALLSLWTIVKTAFFGDLGELATGERTLRIMARAGGYNRFLCEMCRPYLGRSVIEIGSGVGNLSRFLLDRAEVVLTDTDDGYLRILSDTYRSWGYVQVRRLDVTNAADIEPFRGRFDSVLCFNVIEHVEADAAALRNIAALLAPGGQAAFIVPAHQWLYGSLDRYLGHFRRYSADGFAGLLREAGFEPVLVRLVNPLAVPGWWFNGRVLGRRVLPSLQVAVFGRLVWLVKLLSRWQIPVGISVLAVARKPR